MDLSISGLASGFDWQTLVDQLAQVERAPQQRLRTEQTTLQQRSQAYGSLVTELGTLNSKIADLNSATLFDSRLTRLADDTVASASADTSAVLGSYTFAITHLATASVQQGGLDAGAGISATDDVAGLVLSDAAFASAVTAGTFTVNGKTVTVATSDTLQQVFANVSTATGGAVTGSYDATTDKITFSSGSPIVLGSAADTSNFLQVIRLSNNGTGTVTSSASLGVLKLGATLSAANSATAISDGGSGAGEFKINGVSISFNAGTDSLATVIGRINASSAGVTASYDSVNDRLLLSNKTTGDLGVGLEDVTGNFLAATKLSSGTLQRGNDLLYTINGGDPLTSHSNTITAISSGITGLSVTALKEGSTTVEVASDTAKIKTAITDFVTEYNKVQSLINTQTASSTDAQGKVTAGILAGELGVASLASQLRSLVFSEVSGLSGSISRLSALGYDTNGNDDTLTLSDPTKLDTALASNLSSVKEFFTTASTGIGTRLDTYLTSAAGDDGSLVDHQKLLDQQSANIDTQIADMERLVQLDRDRMTASFVAMEQARSTLNAQMEFLTQQLNSTKA